MSQKTRRITRVDFFLDDALLFEVLVPDIEDAVGGAAHDAGDDHPFDYQMRRVPHDVAVFDRPRLALVGITHDVLLIAGRVADRLPLEACRKPCAAESTQRARLERRDDALAIAGRS